MQRRCPTCQAEVRSVDCGLIEMEPIADAKGWLWEAWTANPAVTVQPCGHEVEREALGACR